jgi:F-type H+-transporting ATPase subunit a
MTNFFLSPLEQFEITPLLSLAVGLFDLSITNQTYILWVILSVLVALFFSLESSKDGSFKVIPTAWQSAVELIYNLVLNMVVDSIAGKSAQKFFPLIFTVFIFIVSMNLIGLIPYSFTVTSHLATTLALSLSVFIGINIICIKTHSLKAFSLFLPAGAPILLAFLLVPVELVLYLFRPLSLAIRLFSNMMAGHTLLKVFAGFAWSLMSFSGILFLFHFVPLLTLLPLFGLELGVAVIQAFVFSLLLCIYLNDAINLH